MFKNISLYTQIFVYIFSYYINICSHIYTHTYSVCRIIRQGDILVFFFKNIWPIPNHINPNNYYWFSIESFISDI